MAWDLTLPAGSEAISNGDNRIRELKTDIQAALRGQASSGVEAVFPGSDAANPVFHYRGIKDITGSRPASGQYGLFFDSTRNVLQRDNGVSWDDVGTVIAAAAVLVFYQASVPTGFTAVAQNDKALRVVTGGTSGGSAGGTTAFSSCWVATATGAEAAHTHAVNIESGDGTVVGAGAAFAAGAVFHHHQVTGTTAAGSSHSHTITAYAPQYVDVILGTKT